MAMVGGGVDERITRRATQAGLVLEREIVCELAQYLELLFRWNRRMNLTALTDDDNGVDRLVIEPLAAAQLLPEGCTAIIDIGSGGGSPAIPMKLVLPTTSLRMVESKVRKGTFLKEVVRQLGLRDTEVLNCRYEELVARPETHEVADVVTVRGVCVDSRMLQVLRTLVREGGAVFLFRGATEQVFPPEACLSLKYLGTYPLVDSLKSQVTVLKKTKGE